MSFHNKPDYHIPELIEALKAHRLPHDTPSQLADSFRIGWMACRELAQADSVREDAGRIEKWSDRIQRVHPKSEPEFWPDALRVKYMADEISDLRAARAPADSVLEDAARYRWLCCKFGETRFPCALENWLEHGYIADGKPSIDAAIDAAIKQGEKQ